MFNSMNTAAPAFVSFADVSRPRSFFGVPIWQKIWTCRIAEGKDQAQISQPSHVFFWQAGDVGQTFRLVHLLWMDRLPQVSDLQALGCQR